MEFYIGQICYFGFEHAPKGWASCHGQILSITDHQALFSLIGDNYGGDGRTNFALPDLRGATPLGQGPSPIGNMQMGEATSPSYAHAENTPGSRPVAGGLVLNPCICINGIYPSRR